MDGQASDQLLGVLSAASHRPVAGSTGVSKEVAGARETPVVLKHGDVPVRVLTVMELEEIGALRAAAKRRLLSFHVTKVFKVAERHAHTLRYLCRHQQHHWKPNWADRLRSHWKDDCLRSTCTSRQHILCQCTPSKRRYSWCGWHHRHLWTTCTARRMYVDSSCNL